MSTGINLTCLAQPVERVSFQDPDFFKTGLSISGLTIAGDTFYAVAERSGKLLKIRWNDQGKLEVKKKPVDISNDIKDSAQLEGVAYYHGHLLITDEHNTRIYDHNIISGKTKTIPKPVNKPDVFRYDSGTFGMEGITVDTVNNKCYVLKERAVKASSIVREFAIKIDTNNNIQLTYLKDLHIKHVQLNAHSANEQRYADIFYHHQDKKLYFLRTYFGKPAANRKKEDYETQLQYKIDAMPVNGSLPDSISSAKINLLDITKQVDDLREKYNTNLEGIAIYRNRIYLISDNVWGIKTDKSTLMIKVATSPSAQHN